MFFIRRDPYKPDLQLLIETTGHKLNSNAVESLPMKIGAPTFISTVLRPVLNRVVFLKHVVRQKKIEQTTSVDMELEEWIPLKERKRFTPLASV